MHQEDVLPRPKALVAVKKYYELISVDSLKVDPLLNAQRQFNPVWANALEKIWDSRWLLPAMVSRRPNGDYLIDGQHSTAVALRLEGPDFKRDCMVYEGLSEEDEARLFLAANRDRKQVSHFDTFRVSVKAGEPLACRVLNEVRAVSLDVAAGTSTNRIGGVQALLTIGKMREGLITRALVVVASAWGRDKASWDSMVLRAVAIVINDHWDVIDDKRLYERLMTMPVGMWKSKAMSLTPSGGGSESRSTPLAKLIVAHYNKPRLSKDKRLPED